MERGFFINEDARGDHAALAAAIEKRKRKAAKRKAEG